jgi:cyclic pyranopterin phosphate synthase
MMLDKYSREINYLRVSITDRCNLRCIYCRPKEGVALHGHEDILRYEEMIRVISLAVKMGLIKVRLTGGEPLVRRGFVDFIADLNKIEGLKDISLTTNGILLEQFAQGMFDAGIRRINVSLDSLNRTNTAKLPGADAWKMFCGELPARKKSVFRPSKSTRWPSKDSTMMKRWILQGWLRSSHSRFDSSN